MAFPGSMFSLWFVYVITRHPLLVMCSLSGLSQNQAVTPGSVLSLWFVYLRTRRSILALCYLSGLFVSDPGIHFWLCYLSGLFISEQGINSWLYLISLVCLSQNQVVTPGSMLSLSFVYLRSRHPLLVL